MSICTNFFLFNIFNDLNITIDGITVDVNPIRPEETGTLDEYLPKAEAYLEQKQAERAEQVFSSSVGENEKMGLEAPKPKPVPIRNEGYGLIE